MRVPHADYFYLFVRMRVPRTVFISYRTSFASFLKIITAGRLWTDHTVAYVRTRTRGPNLRLTPTAVKLAGIWQKPYGTGTLPSMRLRESKAEHRSSSCHAFVPEGQPSPSTKYSSTRFSQWEDGAGLCMHEWI